MVGASVHPLESSHVHRSRRASGPRFRPRGRGHDRHLVGPPGSLTAFRRTRDLTVPEIRRLWRRLLLPVAADFKSVGLVALVPMPPVGGPARPLLPAADHNPMNSVIGDRVVWTPAKIGC